MRDIEERQVNLIKRKKVSKMTEKDKALYEKTVKDLEKLDYQSLVILQASIKMLAARQEMDENKPTTAA